MTLQSVRRSLVLRRTVLTAFAALVLAGCGGGGQAGRRAAAAPSPAPSPTSACDVQKFLEASNAVVEDSLAAQTVLGSYPALVGDGFAGGMAGQTASVESQLLELRAKMSPPSAVTVAASYAAARRACLGDDAVNAAAPSGCDPAALVTAADAVAEGATKLRVAGQQYERLVRDAMRIGAAYDAQKGATLRPRMEAIKNSVITDQALTVAENYTTARNACEG